MMGRDRIRSKGASWPAHPTWTNFAVILLLAIDCLAWSGNVAAASSELDRQFTEVVQPFLSRFCFRCHGPEKQEAKLNLSDDASPIQVVRHYKTWDLVSDRLVARDMPPQVSDLQPTDRERQAVIEWIKAVRKEHADLNAGDPGPVLARRLSNAEYDNTIRDLTGVNIRPTREFPVDPANEAGFDNSGESLTMSPALVKKYLDAARLVSEHVVLTPEGLEFAPHPAVAETDRDKYCVQQIVSFYSRHAVDYADYFYAAWMYEHREPLRIAEMALSDIAINFPRLRHRRDSNQSLATQDWSADTTAERSSRPLSPQYFGIIWKTLTDPTTNGPLKELRSQWKAIPNDPNARDKVYTECVRLKEFVEKTRKEFVRPIEKLHVNGNSDGSQPLVLWWNRQVASRRMSYQGDGQDPELDQARERFSSVFPDAFSISSRGHYADPNLGSQVRLLTAGFHLMQGYFRDDAPLRELVLSDAERVELDGLWKKLDFVTLAPIRQYKDFLFFERAEPPQFAGGPEFDFARPENKDVTSDENLKRMRDLYLSKARQKEASPSAIEAIETYFHDMLTTTRWIDDTQNTAQPLHLQSLTQFAERAYRRPLSRTEQDELIAFYQRLRTEDGLGHEDAIRDSIASILMSPYFCFRFDLAAPDDSPRPLSDDELASRLSYFLWSSMPDDELLTHARQGDLHQPEVLKAQARRMLRDPRVIGLAKEFAGNWLDFRRFEEHNSVDRDRFPTFTNELREAMFEEPLRFFVDVASENRSVLDFLDGRDTFVNAVLASHYQIPLTIDNDEDAVSPRSWIHVTDASDYGRGGLLPMSVFLTANSPGLRTSPVKRGYWVVRRLLGEHIPPPPPQVPELPKDEASSGELSLPQALALHRNHPACSGCHQRFDSMGLMFEGFGPTGERRDKDLGGRPIDNAAVFPNGKNGQGVADLQSYLMAERRAEFLDNLYSKLLAYALGRSLMLSDQKTLEVMRDQMAEDGHRFQTMIDAIVTSPQFLRKRGFSDQNLQ